MPDDNIRTDFSTTRTPRQFRVRSNLSLPPVNLEPVVAIIPMTQFKKKRSIHNETKLKNMQEVDKICD